MLRLPIVSCLVAVLLLAACGGEGAEGDVIRSSADTAVEAVREADGVQVVEVSVGLDGFEPSAVRLEAGVPARLVITRTDDSACSEEVAIPAFDVAPVALPVGVPVAVAFTPDEEGTFTFACGMDMLRGTIVVES